MRRGGTVSEDVIVANGDVRVAGRVDGDLVTFAGRAYVLRGASIERRHPLRGQEARDRAGGRVGGDVSRIDVDLGGAAPFVGALAWWLAVSVSTLLLGLLALWIAPRAADAVREQMRDGGWGPAAGVGLALMICLPLLALLAFVTLLGIPFAIGLLFALVPLAALGYVTACMGARPRARRLPAHRRATAFLAGWAILRGVALIPLFGAIVFLVAAMLGLGALACALWAARGPALPPGPEMPASPTAV